METEALRKAQIRYPKATFYNRQVFNNVYFVSISFKRSKHGNYYVAFKKGGCQYFGQIQFFFELKESTSDNKISAYLKLLTVKEKIGPIKGYFYRVSWTPNEEAVAIESLVKVFFLADFSGETPEILNEYFIVKLNSKFEHS